MTLSITNTHINNALLCIMLSVVMLSVIILKALMMNVAFSILLW
jgi:hypothetical protein